VSHLHRPPTRPPAAHARHPHTRSIGVFCFAQLALYYESKARTHNRWQLGGLVAVQSAHARSEEAEAALSVIDQPLRSSFSVTAAAPERPRTPCLTAPRPMPMGTGSA
jgi:hypothetical protein